MMYVLFPKTPTASILDDSQLDLQVVSKISLGGFFYDFLRAPNDALVGIRYYVDIGTAFDAHPVFGEFNGDERFVFRGDKGYVDIYFDGTSSDPREEGTVQVDCVQEFGGDSVVKRGGGVGISFNL